MTAAIAAVRDVDFAIFCRREHGIGKRNKLLQAQAALSPHATVQSSTQSAVVGPSRGLELRSSLMSSGGESETSLT